MPRKALFLDTSPAAERELFAVLSAMGRRERARLGYRHNSNCHSLMRRALARQRFGWPDGSISIEWARVHYGDEVAASLRHSMRSRTEPLPAKASTWAIGCFNQDTPEAKMLSLVTGALDEVGALWFVGGSFAACACGCGYPARDIDIIAPGLSAEHGKYLQEKLGREFFCGQAVWDGSAVWNFVYHAAAWKIDIFAPALGDYEREALERRWRCELFGDESEFWVEDVEDVLLSRLRWIKSSGRHEQAWREVLGVLKAGCFDGYDDLHRWAPYFGVADLLEKAIEEAELKEARDRINGLNEKS